LGSGFRIFAFLISLVIFVPLSIALGGMAFLWAASGIPNLANYAFLFVFLYVLLANLFGIFGNEFMDSSKLLLYPVSPTLVFTASVVGNMFAPIFLFSLPMFLGLIAGMSAGGGMYTGFGATLIRLGLLVLFWLLTVAASQLVGLISVNMLKTRRFQDLVRIVAPLGGLTLYIGIQVLLHGGNNGGGALSWLQNFPWPLRLLPSYWVSGLFTDFAGARFPLIVLMLVGTLYGIGLLFFLGGWFQKRAFEGTIATVGGPKPATGGEEDLPSGRPSFLSHFIPDQVLAVARKEFLLYRREPGFKTLIIQQALIVVLILVFQWMGMRTGGGMFLTGEAIVYFVTGLFIYFESTILLNQFGPEGMGLEFLFLHPTSRRRILLGKNLAGVLFFMIPNTFIILLVGAVAGSAESVSLAWTFQLGALIIISGFGNWPSVLVASPMFVRGKTAAAQMRREQLGCLRPVFSMAALLGLAIVMGPLILLAYWVHDRAGAAYLLLIFVVTVAYSVILYDLFLALGAAVLRNREQQLIAQFTRSPD